MIYRVSIKSTKDFKEIKATTELEARTKYCQTQGFNYRVFANKLQVVASERKKENAK